MKRFLLVVCACAVLLLAAAVFFAGSRPVSARTIIARLEPPAPGVADGSWVWDDSAVNGSEIPVDLSKAPAPAWQDVMSWNALEIDGAATICHPFRGGQLGWIPTIRLFSGSSWDALATTLQWVPDEEGQLMACAQAAGGGTYALFGGYVRPAASIADKPLCNFEGFTFLTPLNFMDPMGDWFLAAIFPTLTDSSWLGTPVSYTMSDLLPLNKLTGPGTVGGSSVVSAVDPVIVHFNSDPITFLDRGPDLWYTVRLEFPTCYTVYHSSSGLPE